MLMAPKMKMTTQMNVIPKSKTTQKNAAKRTRQHAGSIDYWLLGGMVPFVLLSLHAYNSKAVLESSRMFLL